MMALIVPVKEKNIPQSGTENTGQAAVDSHIKNVLVPAAILLCKEICHSGGKDDAEA